MELWRDFDITVVCLSLSDPHAVQVHGDVFRAPSALVLFSSFVGTGTQIAALVTQTHKRAYHHSSHETLSDVM